MVKDPVCGMEIDPNSAAGEADLEGVTYYFCSVGCKKAFEKDPRRYVHPRGEAPHQH
jgi:Cu+-exporting ATPase